MRKEILVPPLGESVTEATIAKWLKKVGDRVEADEALVELETDKVTLEINAPLAGVLEEMKVAQGGKVAVGDEIGAINSEGLSAVTAPKTPAQVEEKPAPVAAPLQEDNRLKMPPAVSKMVAENNIDPLKIEGTGKDGRLIKADVQNYLATPALTTFANAPTNGGEERVRMSRLRQRIAERLKDAQNTAAMLTTFNEVDMSRVIAARAQYKDQFEKKHGVRLGFMSFFVKACVAALKEIPAVNAEIDGDELVYKKYYDIGVAVSAPQGLVVPVIRGADELSFAGIEKKINELGLKARENKLAMTDLTGGTFTITNGGTFGSLMSTPIINPPQSGILGMHKIQERPVAIDGKVEIRPMMYVALTYDHRIIDGREAVTFLVRVKECIENPERILLEI